MDWFPKKKVSVTNGEFQRRLVKYSHLWSKWVPPESLGTFQQGTINKLYLDETLASQLVGPGYKVVELQKGEATIHSNEALHHAFSKP